MKIYSADNISDIYKEIFTELKSLPIGSDGTHELNNVIIELTNVNKSVVNNRNISLHYLCGELLWYALGINDLRFISQFSTVWKKLSDDGKTSNSAYGYILKNKFGFDQIEKVIELLTKFPDSRRAVLNLNTPNINVIETKDEICTIAIQFLIRNNKLSCTVYMRSNDIYTGLPYDIAFFTSLQKYIANKLRIECGNYYHIDTSLHLYEKDINKVIKYDGYDINVDFKLLYDEYITKLNDLDISNNIVDIFIKEKILIIK